jgi:hypothetical protein
VHPKTQLQAAHLSLSHGLRGHKTVCAETVSRRSCSDIPHTTPKHINAAQMPPPFRPSAYTPDQTTTHAKRGGLDGAQSTGCARHSAATCTERFSPRCRGGENGDHLCTRPHKRKGGKVGRTGGAHSTGPRLPYIAASRHGRPASCRRLSQAAPMLLLRRRTTNSPTRPAHHYGLLPTCAGSGVDVALRTAPGLPR